MDAPLHFVMVLLEMTPAFDRVVGLVGKGLLRGLIDGPHYLNRYFGFPSLAECDYLSCQATLSFLEGLLYDLLIIPELVCLPMVEPPPGCGAEDPFAANETRGLLLWI